MSTPTEPLLTQIVHMQDDEFDALLGDVWSIQSVVEHMAQWDYGTETDADRQAIGEYTDFQYLRTMHPHVAHHGGLTYLVTIDENHRMATLYREVITESELVAVYDGYTITRESRFEYDTSVNATLRYRWTATASPGLGRHIVGHWDPRLGYVIKRYDPDLAGPAPKAPYYLPSESIIRALAPELGDFDRRPMIEIIELLAPLIEETVTAHTISDTLGNPVTIGDPVAAAGELFGNLVIGPVVSITDDAIVVYDPKLESDTRVKRDNIVALWHNERSLILNWITLDH